jgi:lipid II isoglutaminyl synthase (glutamine-hydrolysing)
LRQTLAIATGKLAKEVLRRTGRGATALPGLLATRLDPHILRDLTARLPGGSLMVIGTNGKTTTTRLISTILNHAGLKIVNNRSGSNLVRGLASTVLEQASLSGKLAADMGLFEVDEAAFPAANTEIVPRLILVNNLFRDQLDRYGEVDTIRKRWLESIKKLASGTTLVMNADDPSLAYLARFAPPGVKVVFFGVDAPALKVETLAHAADSARCILCGAELIYEAIYISHVGHYRCPNCDFRRPDPQFVARDIKLSGTSDSHFTLHTPDGEMTLTLGVPGLYNVYNAVGAAAATLTLGLAPRHVQAGLAEFKSAFGRIERVSLPDDKQLLLALVKNPVGFNEVLRMLTTDPNAKLKLLVIINDLDADGRDVSWLWDVDFEILAGHLHWAATSGLRATDMANRLKYAGVEPELLSWEEDISAALKVAIARLTPGETLYITPTYTAMLQLRAILQKMDLVVPFWEE